MPSWTAALGMKVFEGSLLLPLRDGTSSPSATRPTQPGAGSLQEHPGGEPDGPRPTLEGVEELLDNLPVEVAYLGYDLET